MASGTPYIPFFTSDFLNGVADLEDREIGIYTIVLMLMADQGGPIDDDARWLARRSGSTTRRVNQCLAALERAGKIERRNGLIGNRKMLEVIRNRAGKSEQARQAAHAKWENWRADHRPTLPFMEDIDEQNSEKKRQKKSRKNDEKPREKTQKNSAQNSDIPQNSANSSLRTHADSRGRVNPELESINQTNDSIPEQVARETKSDDRPIDSDRDLIKLLETVSATAGYVPRGTDGYVKAVDQVRAWRDAGIDFTETVLPCIEHIVAHSNDTTSSLTRFDRAVRHRHAQHCAARNLPNRPPAPPVAPITKFDDEDPEHETFRKILLKQFGNTYAIVFHKVRFETLQDLKVRPLRINQRGTVRPDLDSIRHIVTTLAKKHGWGELW